MKAALPKASSVTSFFFVKMFQQFAKPVRTTQEKILNLYIRGRVWQYNILFKIVKDNGNLSEREKLVH